MTWPGDRFSEGAAKAREDRERTERKLEMVNFMAEVWGVWKKRASGYKGLENANEKFADEMEGRSEKASNPAKLTGTENSSRIRAGA